MKDSTGDLRPLFRPPPPSPAGAPQATSEETLVGRWQNAHQVHECNGCVEAIEVGEGYLRMVDVARVEVPEGWHVDQLQPAVLWGLVARQRIPVEKYHEACWHREITVKRRVLKRITS